MSSIEFATLVFGKGWDGITAGAGCGEYGEGYFRISLTIPDVQLGEG